jgi:hypothetical protein
MRKLMVITLSFLLSLVFFSSFENSPTYSLYYGDRTSNYKTTGYAVMDLGNGDAGLCGINAISETIGITAAHCLEGANRVYGNWKEFDEDFKTTSPKFYSLSISPEYNKSSFGHKPGLADVGFVVFSDKIPVEETAVIRSPKEGCGYYLVGYGENQTGDSLSRTGTDVCIENITEYSFELEFDGISHFCVGDSGSGIYRKNSNEIVGIVSAFYTSPTSNKCADGTAFVAARLDYNYDYLSKYLPQSAFIANEVPIKEETVPNDYFGDYHPETKNDDGSYNYNNEIISEIEGLSQTFDEIYPEDSEAKPLPEDDSDYEYYDQNKDGPIMQNVPNSDPEIRSLSSTIISLLYLGFCCLMPLILIASIVVLFIIIKKRKKVDGNTTGS